MAAGSPAPRKCETPGCTAEPCPPRRDPEGIDQSYKRRPAWIWECECGWKTVRPTLELTLGEQQLSAGVHIDTVVDRIVEAVEQARVLPTVSFDGGVALGVEVKI